MSPAPPSREPPRWRITPCRSPADYARAAELFREYAARLGVDLCFQGFAQELDRLPEMYGPPHGILLLAHPAADTDTPGAAREAAACGALRPFEPGVCEMKRLYVRPAARGHGLGRRIAEHLLAHAHASGYRCMRLDTLADMHAAITLYESLGFRRIPPYYHNPLGQPVFFERTIP